MKKIIRRCQLLNRMVESGGDCSTCKLKCENPGGRDMKHDRPTFQVIVKGKL